MGPTLTLKGWLETVIVPSSMDSPFLMNAINGDGERKNEFHANTSNNDALMSGNSLDRAQEEE